MPLDVDRLDATIWRVPVCRRDLTYLLVSIFPKRVDEGTSERGDAVGE